MIWRGEDPIGGFGVQGRGEIIAKNTELVGSKIHAQCRLE